MGKCWIKMSGYIKIPLTFRSTYFANSVLPYLQQNLWQQTSNCTINTFCLENFQTMKKSTCIEMNGCHLDTQFPVLHGLNTIFWEVAIKVNDRSSLMRKLGNKYVCEVWVEELCVWLLFQCVDSRISQSSLTDGGG